MRTSLYDMTCSPKSERSLAANNSEGRLKSQRVGYSVIPAKAGIQEKQTLLDPGFRRGDGFGDFLQTH